jgi:tight adherence protein C
MDAVNATLQELGNLLELFASGSGAAFLGVLFAAVFLAVMGVGALVRSGGPAGRRLAGGEAPKAAAAPAEGVPLRQVDREGIWDRLLKPIEKHTLALLNDQQQSSLRKRMIQAGFVNPSAARIFFAVRVFLTFGLPALWLFVAPLFSRDMSIEKVLLFAFMAAMMGLYLPRIWISHRIDKRTLAYQEAFPDALDMLVVCVEAGLGLDAAFTRVGSQIAPAHPLLAQQFGMVSLELRAGKSRETALRNMAHRIGIDEVSAFVTLLIQSDALGTSIALTLRVYAEEMRVKRMLRAEEMAHKLPVKLVVPLVTCVLPAMLVAVLLPAMIEIIRNIMPHLGN